jgi:uncharacterized protein YjbJ (UPF0337 family)
MRKDIQMNSDTLKGNWKELKGKVKQKWSKLNDDLLDQADGKKDEIVGQIQKAYGKSKEEAEKDFDSWQKTNQL